MLSQKTARIAQKELRLLGVLIGEYRKKDIGVGEILSHPNLVNREHPQPRIFQFLVYQNREDFLDLLGNPVGAFVLCLHGVIASSLELPSNLPSIKHFDLVVDANIIIVFDANAAFSPVTRGLNLIFKVSEALKLAFVDHDVVP